MIRYALNMPLAPFRNRINFDDKVMLLGSCFTEHIGTRLNAFHFNTFMNPNGIVFNPLSLADPLNRMLSSEKYSKEDVIFQNDKWVSFQHSNKFSENSMEDLLANINRRQSEFENVMSSADWLIITFGTAWVYEYTDLKMIVANCHKIPQALFSKRLLEVNEVVDGWHKTLELLKKHNSQLKIIFTVSPVKHLRDGVHENNLSKSTLLLAIQKLCSEGVYYFPAYELVNDDLRDYRFYDADGAHPNSMAIDYVFEQFRQNVLSAESNEMLDVLDKYFKLKNHRPLNNSESDIGQINDKLEVMKKELVSKNGRLKGLLA